MKVLGLAELLELIVDGLRFRHVRLHRQELLISFSDEVLELLLHLQLRQPLLQSFRLELDEFGQVVGNFLVGVEGEDVLGGVESDLQLFADGGVVRHPQPTDGQLDKRLK
jgi:hypothetical protein